VALIWTLELDDPRAWGATQRILPDGIVEVIFHWREPFAMSFAHQYPAVQPRSFAVAQARRFIEIAPLGPSGFLSVRFRHGGGCHFMRPPVSAFADGLVATGDLWGTEGDALQAKLEDAPSIEARVRLVEGFLLLQLARHYRPGVDHLASAMFRRPGPQRIADLCRDLGVGERRLERIARTALGVSPKQSLTLARFLRACRLIRTGSRSLADVAQVCGYYDQAHLNGDFKALSGMTPRQFATAQAVSVLALE
jgi:AraC-like DNA-binding protein